MRTKLSSLFLIPLFALCALFSSTASAGEFSALSFPKGMGAALSIPSTARLLERVDAGVAAATAGTEQSVPAGFIRLMAAMNLPFLVTDDTDWEIHVFMPPVAHQLGMMGHAVVVANTSLDEFTRALETVGATFAPNPDGSLQMEGNRIPPYNVRDAGDGMVALGFAPAVTAMMAGQVKEGWRPGRWVEGELGFAVDKPGTWLLKTDALFAGKLSSVREWLAAEPPTPALEGADREALLKVLDVCGEAATRFEKELAGIERLGLDLGLDGERLKTSLLVRAAPETTLGAMAAAAAERDNLPPVLARKVGADSIQLMSVAAWEDMLPGSGELLTEYAEKFADAVFTAQNEAQKEKLLTGIRRFLSVRSGETVAGGQYRDGTVSADSWLSTEDPSALFDALGEIAEAMNSVYRTVFPGYADGEAVRLEEGSTPGGVRYRNIALDPGFAAKYTHFWNELTAALHGVPPRALTAQALASAEVRSITAPGDGFLAVVSGPDREKRLADALSADPAEPAFLDSPAAAQALAGLARRQNLVALTDYDFLTRSMLANGLFGALAGPGGVLSPEKLSELEPEFRNTSSLVGVALGSADGCLVADAFIPTDTVSVMIHNFALVHEAAKGSGAPMFMNLNALNALIALKSYAVAEITFHVGRQGKVAGNTNADEMGYADNFRNLYFGTPLNNNSINLELIALGVANAFAGPTSGAETVASIAQPAETAVPHDGYLFLEPPGIDFARSFALVAYPASFGRTGNRIFYIDDNAALLEMNLDVRSGGLPVEGEMPALITVDELPGANPGLWKLVDEGQLRRP